MEFKSLKRPLAFRILLPLYIVVSHLFPKSFAKWPRASVSLHASAMLEEGNWLYKLIYPRFFRKMRYELPHNVNLQQYAAEGTLVYVGTQIQELEYNYFSHLFHKLKLPLSVYANGLSLRRWMKWKDFRSTICAQFECMRLFGGIPHPASSGELTNMVAQGMSVMFSLTSAELEEDQPAFSESYQLLLSVAKAQHYSQKPIYIVPLNFIWDRRPKKHRRSIIDILFGEKERPGRLRKTVLFWKNYKRRAVIQIGTPIDIKAFSMERPGVSDEELTRHISSRIMDTIMLERRAITGPPIRSQRWFIEKTLNDPWLTNQLAKIAVERSKDLGQLTILAKRYAKEIASNINYRVIEMAANFVKWILSNLFEDISIDSDNLERIKELSAYTPLVFVPNHRSHMDYLLLSTILYDHQMTVPFIAAGINLSFWPLGAFFRSGGAYFIRRKFHGNPVYKATVQTYLGLLIHEGYSQEFFIEGGRSRTGKLSPPRLGMLSMLADAVLAGASNDLIFVPVSITYDRVMEHKAYTHEIKGGSKKSESMFDVLGLAKFLRKQKERNGAIYVRFGMPLSLSGAAFDAEVDYPFSSEAKNTVVPILADQICHEINRLVVVTPLSITSMALLLWPRRAVTIQDFNRRTLLYLDYLAFRDTEISESLSAFPSKALKDTLTTLERSKIVRFHSDTEFPFYEVLEERRISLDYYKNTSVHFFASISFVCAILKKRRDQSLSCNTSDIVESLRFLQELFQFEFRFSREKSIEDRVKPLLSFLQSKDAIDVDTMGNIWVLEGGMETIEAFSELVKNVTDAYKCALFVLKRIDQEVSDERFLVKKMLEEGPKLFLLGHIGRTEAVSKENFTHAIAAFREVGAIQYNGDDSLGITIKHPHIDQKRVANLQEQLERVI